MADQLRHQHVLEGRQLGQQVIKLEDEPERAVAKLVALALAIRKPTKYRQHKNFYIWPIVHGLATYAPFLSYCALLYYASVVGCVCGLVNWIPKQADQNQISLPEIMERRANDQYEIRPSRENRSMNALVASERTVIFCTWKRQDR